MFHRLKNVCDQLVPSMKNCMQNVYSNERIKKKYGWKFKTSFFMYIFGKYDNHQQKIFSKKSDKV